MTDTRPVTVLRVRNWDDRHETYESKKRVKTTHWFATSNDLSDPWFVAIMSREDGPSLWGIATTLLMMASRCPVRGTFADREGNPYTVETIASVCRVKPELMANAINVLTSEIPWLEYHAVNTEASAGITAGHAEPIARPAVSDSDAAGSPADHAETVGRQDRQNKQDITNRTNSNNNGKSAAAVVAASCLKQWDDARPIARELAELMFGKGAILSALQREWLVKVAMLAVEFGREWLEPAIQGIRGSKPTDPIRYQSSAKRNKKNCN